ncbi:PH domain-containing protein [Corynebacterium auris]|uniref:PH domain-containing protein n=1 Tax=Corynebacterium auris TaxID=44750 RepID=UPI0025B52881|nr:PH domain-containing protein [Corynebacterium auris]
MTHPLPRTAEEMNRVSPKLVVPQYVTLLMWTVIIGAALVVAYLIWGKWWLIPLGVLLAIVLVQAVLIPLRVRAMGWLETDDELVLARGRLWRSMTAVPYGRIQFVDVTSGPVERAVGVKKLEVNTASTTSVSALPGIEAEEADALRDRLAEKARERMSGL